jgi:hypothetical protein
VSNDITVEPGPNCLHCKLIEIIEEHCDAVLKSDAQTNMTDIVAMIVEALGQFLREAIPEQERANTIAFTMEHLGRVLLAREEEGTRH